MTDAAATTATVPWWTPQAVAARHLIFVFGGLFQGLLTVTVVLLAAIGVLAWRPVDVTSYGVLEHAPHWIAWILALVLALVNNKALLTAMRLLFIALLVLDLVVFAVPIVAVLADPPLALTLASSTSNIVGLLIAGTWLVVTAVVVIALESLAEALGRGCCGRKKHKRS